MVPNIPSKGNISLEALATPAIVVLVGLSAFGLGRLSKQDDQKPALVVHQESEASTTPVSTVY